MRGPANAPHSGTRRAAGQARGAPETAGAKQRRLFLHPQWTIGVVVLFGVAALVAGLGNPVWLLIGAPCILALIVWVRMRGGGGR